ncbi:uncharacterized protein LOC121404789 [Drosophila obscura]|uniref:uncharacterized protein LOC121404789 n=1 Tax=Drosophila obscura TaxID=7282 RepID=UPI001BB25DBA|nr:uncharacterized protein LOC121404789 [Drosophila obscura]
MKAPMLCMIMILILLEGFARRKHKQQRTGEISAIICGENESYGCKVCFEPSCNQLLYDHEPCPPGCVKTCNCNIGFVRRKDKCVLKEQCCVGDICKTKKELAVREAQEQGVTPDPKRWARPEFDMELEQMENIVNAVVAYLPYHFNKSKGITIR